MNFNISNLASIVFSVNNKTVEPQKTAAPKEQFQVSPSNQELLSNMNSKQINQLYMQVSQAATNIMNNIQQNVFLRDMMGLPKDWVKLLSEFSNSNSQIANMLNNLNNVNQNSMQEALLLLLAANSKVNLEALAEQLNKNAALMADKMLKYMGNANMSQNNIAQLKNIMTIGASIAGLAQTNPNEFIRDIIQMYLPWLPLVPPKEQDLEEIEGKMSGSGEKDAQVIFYLATNYLGYFKIEILLGNEPEIYINNICDVENMDLKEDLSQTLKDNIKKASIKAKLFFSRKVDEEDFSLKDKQLFIVKSTDSTIGLILIQLVSRIIFEFDETQGQRYAKLNQ